jgi:pyrroline-5-carboxylate reductase
MRISFIGGGTMGEAILKSLLAKKITSPEEIVVSDISLQRREYLAETYHVKTIIKNLDTLKNADVVILAIKPQDLGQAMKELKGKLLAKQLVISIVAGAPLDSLCTGLGHPHIVRSMPNMSAQIGEGITVWIDTAEVTQKQRNWAKSILSSIGDEIHLTTEKYVDMATAISGCGPAYIFLIIESLTDAGVHIGLPRAMAARLAVETTIGSARTIKVTGKHPAELRNMVTSPGGITAEGLLQLESGGLRFLLLKAVIAAYEKSKKIAAK